MPIFSCNFKLAGVEGHQEIKRPGLTKSIRRLARKTGCDELALISTGECIEVFAAGEKSAQFTADAAAFVHQITEITIKELQRSQQVLDGPETAQRFLFRAIGMEPAGTHRHDIQTFRKQFELAREAGSIGPVFSKLYQRGLWLAEKIRLESNLQKNAITPDSVVSELAKKIFGPLGAHQALIWTGPGACDKFVARLSESGIGKLLFTGSGSENKEISNEYAGQLVEPENLKAILPTIDLMLLFDESALQSLLAMKFADIMHKRRNAPMLLVTLFEWNGVAGRTDPFAKFYNVYTYNRDELENVIAANLKEHQKLTSLVQQLVEKEVDDFLAWSSSKEKYRFGNIIGKSEAMRGLMDLIARIAQTDISVLIDGESGTGKELIALSIHNHSRRVNNRFSAVNCGALPESLLESELFGFVKGAFTGAITNKKGLLEEANHGTIFLDEIGETSPATQVKLLRFLQEGEIKPVGSNETLKLDVRVLTATNRNLEKMVAEDKFRQDLYYRLNVIQMTIPPLRERKDDILPLINHFVQKYARQMHKTVFNADEAARQLLHDYNWPGNVRELENAIERAVALSTVSHITVADLPPNVTHPTDKPGKNNLARDISLKELEKQHIAALLKQHEWNYDLVTEILGIGRTTLWRKMKEYGLSN